jgi:hypothetical protein
MSLVDHVSNALEKLSTMDPKVLELAEKYPISARALIDATSL